MNTMATTESEIMSMGMRLAAQGKQVGMTEAQIMALAGTMSSLGIEAEAGGTAMTTVLKKIDSAVGEGGKSLEGFAKASGVSSKDFSKAWKSDPVTALDMFIKGLSGSSKEGKNLTSILDDLGIKGIREADTILRLSGASDLLSSAVNTSTQAWDENNALTNEAQQRYETTASKIKILWNNVKDLGIEMGGYLIPIVMDVVDKIKPLVQKFGEADEGTKKLILAIGGIAAAVGPLLLAFGNIAIGVGGLAGAFGTVSGAIATAGGLSAAFGTALAVLTGPVGITVAALAGLGIGFALLDKEMDKPIVKSDIFAGKISDATKEVYGSYHDLSTDARAELELLANSSGDIASQIASNMVQKYSEMGDQVLNQMKGNHAQQLEELTKYFASSNVLTEEEEAKRIKLLMDKQKEEIKAHTDKQARIMELLNKAASDKYELTSVEIQELRNLTNQANNEALKTLVQSQEDQAQIRKNMKDQNVQLATEEVADMIAKAVETRDGTVKEAKKMRDERVEQITKMKEEGIIQSQEEAYEHISEAQKAYVGVVENANAMYTDTVEAAKKRKDANIEQVNLETGGVLSGWDNMYNGIITAVNWIRGLFGKGALEKSGSVRDSIKQNIAEGFIGTGYANGTPSSGHPGGPAVVGELGAELAHIPGQGVTILGASGPEFYSNLPRGTSVLPNRQTERLLKSYGFPGYADGIGDFFDWFLKGTDHVWNMITDKFNIKDFSSILDNHTGSPLKYVGDMAKEWIQSLFGDMGSIGGAIGGAIGKVGGGVQQWAGIARQALMMEGQYTEANLQRLLYQMQTESGGNPRAINLWDSNAKKGIPSKGLLQTIDPTFRAYARPGYSSDIYDPLSNILASIRYAMSRYGSLERAYRGVGYATGGVINSPHMAMLGENGYKEWVLTSEPRYRHDNLAMWAEAGQAMGIPVVSGNGNNGPQQVYNGDIYVSVDGKDFEQMRNVVDFFDSLKQANRRR